MKEEKITIKLPDGDCLVAEVCPHEGGQIAVGIVRDDIWIQDLAVIETSEKDSNKFNVYVYGNEYDECYTECFEIPGVPSDAL